MQIVPFPHPALRFKSVDITRIDDNLRAIVREMFRLMYAAKGIGLAANQVGLPLRLFIVNASGEKEEPDEEVVFINPVIRNRKGHALGEEGCLSLPGMYADVARAEEIVVEAFDLEGQPFRAKVDELAARVIQHEADHLDGVLFIDRLDDVSRAQFAEKLKQMQAGFFEQQTQGAVLNDDELRQQLEQIASTGQAPPPSK